MTQENESACQTRLGSTKKEGEQIFKIKKNARIYPYSQKRSRWATLQQDAVLTKTPFKDGGLSLYRLSSETSAYDGKIFTLKEGELITASSRNARRLKSKA